MAKMYPSVRETLKGPEAEKMVYRELVHLPAEYHVFHSVNWVKKKFDKNFTYYENDFVILHKEYGILFLEVKGGEIFFRDMLMHQVNSVTREEVILDEGNDPMSQANRGIQHYRHKLNNSVFKYTGSICIEPLVWFPGCDFDPSVALPDVYDSNSFAILSARDLFEISGVSLEKRLEEVYSRYRAKEKTQISDAQFSQIIAKIAPDFDLIPSISINKKEIESEYIRLTDEQAVVLEYLDEQPYVAIQGAAGTGKTMIAVKAAERFADSGHRVLFLCYNRFLRDELAKANTKNNSVDYYNIDAFVTEYCQGTAGNVANRLAALQAIDIDQFPYNDIVIDEAQDFGDKEILYFKELCALRENRLLVFFDKNQVVLYDNSIPVHPSVDEDGNEENEELTWINKSECRLILSRNCRNTKEIARTAYNVIDNEVKQKMNDVSGDKPTIVFAEKDPIKVVTDVVQFYLGKGYKSDDISILSMKGDKKSFLSGKKQIGGIKLKDNPFEKGVLFTTARKYKGLENKVIIITDIDEKCFSVPAIKNVFYVACSRATYHLTLVINGTKEEISRIADKIEGSSFSPQGKIMSKTKTSVLKL